MVVVKTQEQEYLAFGLWEDTQDGCVGYVDATNAGDAEEQMHTRYGDTLRIVGVVTVDEHGRMVMWWCGGDG